jgi:hypothetical protein
MGSTTRRRRRRAAEHWLFNSIEARECHNSCADQNQNTYRLRRHRHSLLTRSRYCDRRRA